MNVMLQRHCARYIYVVPEGLRELMSDISREVIRNEPDNIYTFIADYLDALLITRENARVAARLVQSITEISTTTVEFLLRTGMNRSEADRVVSAIERAFRKNIHLEAGDIESIDEVEEINLVSDIINQTDIPPDLAEESAKIIQNAYRRFRQRREKERELLSGMVDWRVAARSAIRLYRKTGVTFEEANRAATLIKAAYKGYYTRRYMRKLAEESRLLAEQLDEEELYEEDEEQGEAVDDDHDSKYVKIDYGSIIPHVGFDDTKVAEKASDIGTVQGQNLTREESTASVTVHFTIEGILEKTFEEIRQKDTAPDETEITAMQKPEEVTQKVAHEEVAHEEVAHEEVAHEEVAHEEVVPEEVVHEEVVHGEVVLEEGAPVEVQHEEVAHEEAVNDEGMHGDATVEISGLVAETIEAQSEEPPMEIPIETKADEVTEIQQPEEAPAEQG